MRVSRGATEKCSNLDVCKASLSAVDSFQQRTSAYCGWILRTSRSGFGQLRPAPAIRLPGPNVRERSRVRENNVPYGNELENKAEFVDGAVKSHWKSIVASDETVSIVGDIAISRFTVAGESESHGKVSAVKLGALMVWLEQDGHWKLLARRAVKL
jgi:hypothetical protein